jgi:dodecin
VKAAEGGKLRPPATRATDSDPEVLGETTVSNLRETIMSVVKVIELSAQSAQGYEDAVRQAVERAARTIRNIRSVWVKEFEAVVENDQVTQFRVNVKISFLLDEGTDAGADDLGSAQGMGLPRGEG